MCRSRKRGELRRLRLLSVVMLVASFSATAFAGPPLSTADEYLFPPPEVRTGPPDFVPAAGPAFRRSLAATVPGVTWKNVPLRTLLREIERNYGLAVLRDRRIDPTQRPEIALSNVAARDMLATLAAGVGAEVRIVGDAAFLVPPEQAAFLRTLAELRRQELASSAGPPARRTTLARADVVRWSDLTSSAEVLRTVADRFGLTVENPEALPHDLWPGAILPGVTAAEALTMVLVQFDLTFAWSADLRSIRLAPLPADRKEIALKRVLFSRELPPEKAAVAWEGQVPGIAAEPEAGRIAVTGTVEQFEALERTLPTGRPAATPRGPKPGDPKPPDVPPLSRRRFTLAVARVPASAVMAKLEESGVEFEYDAAALKSGGVDLDAPVTFDLRNATVDEFLKALFAPIGAAFEFRGVTVTLRPKG